jgi:DnaJ-class molecular chaperone
LPTTVEIHDLTRRMDRIDYYVLLGVARDVGPSELQSRFHLLTRRFHPDLFHGRDAALVKAVGSIYRRMNEAYAVLRSPARRERYDAGLVGPTEERAMRLSGDAQNAARRQEATPGATTPVGEYYWNQARSLLKNYQGDEAHTQAVEEAIRLMHTALLFEPRNQHFHTALAHLKSQRAI